MFQNLIGNFVSLKNRDIKILQKTKSRIFLQKNITLERYSKRNELSTTHFH